MGTGLLTLPHDGRALGIASTLAFLWLNVAINVYAGRILHETANALEQGWTETEHNDAIPDEEDSDAANASQLCSKTSRLPRHESSLSTQDGIMTSENIGDALSTTDFVTLSQTLFPHSRLAVGSVRTVYYLNVFLVLGNYILVQSRAVQRLFDWNLESSAALASLFMFGVCQNRTMASLGNGWSVGSLLALAVVVVAMWISPDEGSEDQTRQLLASTSSPWYRQASAAGSIGFAVGSQKLFLNIRHDLDDRYGSGTRVLLYALGGMGVVYTMILSGMPPTPLQELSRIAALFLWAHVVVSYAINSQALCSSLDRWVKQDTLSTTDETSTWVDQLRWSLWTGLVALTAFAVAYSIPFFDDLVSLIGSLTSVPLTLLFPALFWRRRWRFSCCNDLPSNGLLAFSAIFTVVATAGALASISSDWDQS